MHVYLERFGVPARERLQALVAAAKANNPLAPVTIVPPNSYAGVSLRRVLAGQTGLLNVRFMAMARLAEYLGAPSMAAKSRGPLSAAVELAAIKAVATESAGQGVLGRVAGHPALHRTLQSSFRDLANLSEDELNALVSIGPLQEASVTLYHRFRERTAGYYGPKDVVLAAAEAVTANQGNAALRDIGSMVFYLLPPPSPAEAALLEALSNTAECSLVVGQTTEDQSSGSARAWWERNGWHVGAAGSDTEGSPAEGSRNDLAAEAIVSAPDVREEVRHAVRGMLRAAEQGIPFHRMAAFYRLADPYAHQLHMELGFAGMPVAGPDPSPLRESVTGRLLLGLLSVIEDDFGRATLMQWLADRPVWDTSAGRSASAELHQWERLSRQAGVVRGVEQWRERLDRLAANMQERQEEAAGRGEASEARARAAAEQADSARRLAAFVERLSQDKPPPDGSPWSSFAEWAGKAVERYAAGLMRWPAKQQGAHQRVVATLGELGALDALGLEATLPSFRQALEHALAAPVGRSGATGTGVFVAGMASAVGMEFEAVWVLGMAEGAFPPRSADDPLVPDEVRETLQTPALPLRRDSVQDERRHYLAALASGQQRTLSYSRIDPVTRRPQYPSPWLLDTASVLADKPVASGKFNGVTAPWMTVIESMEDTLGHAANGRAADAHEYDLAHVAEWRRAGVRLNAHPLADRDLPLGRALAMERARAQPDLTEWDGFVGGMAVASRRLSGALSRTMSPSRLESWATCPYQLFLGGVLYLSAWETPEEALTISPRDRGSLVHAILERFIKEALDGGAPPPGVAWTPQQRERLMAIAREEFQKAEEQGVTGRRVLWEVVQNDILQDLETFLLEDSQRRAEMHLAPLHAEYRFGFGGPPVTLALPDGGQISFRGIIDRVDAAPDGSRALVMDYKTGSSRWYENMRKDPLQGGAKLQLPVYALAVRESLLRDAELTAEYWFVSANGGFQRVEVALADVEGQFAQTVQAIVQGVRGGVFPANPGASGRDGPQNCRYCDFKRICPSNKQALWAGKQASREAAPYVALTAGGAALDVEEGEA